MKKLIEAFNIFAKYTDDEYPTNCVHDELQVVVDPSSVSEEDLKKLEDFGFHPRPSDMMFVSSKYGSC